MLKNKAVGIMVGTVGVLLASAASALSIGDTVSRNVPNAVGFNDQIGSGNPATLTGVDLSILFSFTREGDTTGTFKLDVENISTSETAILGAIGIDMFGIDPNRHNDGTGDPAEGLSFVDGSFIFTAGSCTVDPAGCDYKYSPNNAALNGFGNVFEINLSAKTDGSINNGLNIGEDGSFEWDVTATKEFLDSVSEFTDLVDVTETIDTVLNNGDEPGIPINAFWMAHMQSISCADNFVGTCTNSVKIGGGVTTEAPEPSTLALFGLGLLGLGAAARRRQRTS